MGAKHEQESGQVISFFVEALDVGEDIAEVLVEEGFTTLEEVAYVPLEEMMSIEGFDEDIAQELRARAKDALLTQAIASEEKLESAEPAGRFIDIGWHGKTPCLHSCQPWHCNDGRSGRAGC